MRNPFSLYKKTTKQGPIWYARFWNENARKYADCRSTGVKVAGKKGRQQEAWKRAMELLPAIRLKQMDLAADKPFLDYLAGFWLEGSDYAKDCANIRKRPLSLQYIRNSADDVRLHVAPHEPFRGLALGKLTAGHLRAWMRWADETGRSARRINAALSAMRVAVRYAVANEDLDRDPFKSVGEAAERPREMGILSRDEIGRLVNGPAKNPRDRAVVLLATLCGLRRGEIRGLMWGDVGSGVIDVKHNFVSLDGLKGPKRDSYRRVPVPKVLGDILAGMRRRAGSPEPEGYVFEGSHAPGQPLTETFFRNAFSRELAAIGIQGEWRSRKPRPEGYVNEQKRRNLKLHSLRHCFVTFGRLSGISDMEIQALAGHKSQGVMERYSHAGQVLDFPALREKLELACLPPAAGRQGEPV